MGFNFRFWGRQITCLLRSHSSTAVSDAAAAEQTHALKNFDLSDTRSLFSSVSTFKLLRSALILQLVSIEKVTDLGTIAMNSAINSRGGVGALWRGLVLGTVKHTFFKHFCAGETAADAMQCVQRIHGTGMRGMLDFAVEFATDNASCDANFAGFLNTIESSSPAVSFVAVKVTAIFPLHLLERISDLLRWQRRESSTHLPWKEASFPIFSDSSPLYHTLTKPDPLSPAEEEDLWLGYQRLSTLCERCAVVGVPLVVDAEHTKVQPAIDYITYTAAMRFNRAGIPVVYNTIQSYLRDAKDRLILAAEASEKMGVPMGFKLVRGAYMTSERKEAKELGFESPIHSTILETHTCFNDCASYLLEKISRGHGAAVLATHNIESGRMAAAKAGELGIAKKGKIEFAQLYGMADSLSFGLRNAGVGVSKYMPYGPVDKVIPYLVRRAEENRGVLCSSSIDRELMRMELIRRAKKGFFHA